MFKFYIVLCLVNFVIERSLGRPGTSLGGVGNGDFRMSSSYGTDDTVINLSDSMDDSNVNGRNSLRGDILGSYGSQTVPESQRAGSEYGTMGSRFGNLGTGSGSSLYGVTGRSSIGQLGGGYGIGTGGLSFGNGLMRRGIVNNGGYSNSLMRGGIMGSVGYGNGLGVGFNGGLPRMGGFAGYGGGLPRFGGFNPGSIRSNGIYGSPFPRFGGFSGGSVRSGGLVGGNYNGGLTRFGSFDDGSLLGGGNIIGGNARMFNSMDGLSNPISNNYGSGLVSTASLNQSPRLSVAPSFPQSSFGGYSGLLMAGSSMGSGANRNLMLPSASVSQGTSYSSTQLNPQMNSYSSNTRDFATPLSGFDNSNSNDIIGSDVGDFNSQTGSQTFKGIRYGGNQVGVSSSNIDVSGNSGFMRSGQSKMSSYNLSPLSSNVLSNNRISLNDDFNSDRLNNADNIYGPITPSRSSLGNSYGLGFQRSSFIGNGNNGYTSRSSVIYPSQSVNGGDSGTPTRSSSDGAVSKSEIGYDSTINRLPASSKSNIGTSFNFRAGGSYASSDQNTKNSVSSNDADSQGQQINASKDYSSSDAMKLSQFSMS